MATTNKKTRENKVGKGKAGPGRPKGAQNKVTKDVKAMILHALDKAGGADYLLTQAHDNPNAFLTLVGKVLPLQVTGANGAELPAPVFHIHPTLPAQ